MATIPLLVYALFGTSRRITYGPTAAVAALSFATVSQFADPGSEEFLAYSALLAMVAGVLLLVAGLARWGIIAEFLSEPVLKGFLVKVGLTVAIGQVDKVLRIEPEGGQAFFGQVAALIRELPETHMPSLIVGVAAFLVLRRSTPTSPRSRPHSSWSCSAYWRQPRSTSSRGAYSSWARFRRSSLYRICRDSGGTQSSA